MLSGRRYDGGGGRAFVLAPVPLNTLTMSLSAVSTLHTLAVSHDRALLLQKNRSWHELCAYDEAEM